MKITTENFQSFIDGSYDWDETNECHSGLWIKPSHMDVSGGRITKKEIDQLSRISSMETLQISGLTQDTFEYFITKYGQELRAVRFFKNKLVQDWSLLGSLPELEFVYWFHNQRISHLWDMSENTALKGLCISDFTRLKDLSGIQKATNLEIFAMGDAVWSTTVVNSYLPFADSSVQYLEFFGKKIEDENLSFIETMPNLKKFDFPPTVFTTEKIAWALSNYPDLEGYSLSPLIEDWIYSEAQNCDIPAFCMPGRGKRRFQADNERRKEKSLRKFETLVEYYRGTRYCDAF